LLRAALDPKVYEETLFDALIDARARYGDKEILEDQDRHPLTYTGLIRAAFVLGRKIAKLTQPGERVGVLLPSSAGVVVTFFALHAFGRVPVMLNFTSGEANLKAALKTAGVKKILSAKRFVTQAKLDDLMEALDEVSEIVWLDDIRKTIGFADKMYGLSAGMAPKRFRVKTDPDSAGVVLFTSGSFGAPKGVVLSQKNLVANARQVAAHIDLNPDWVMFNPLPTFHCFGLTGGVLLPLLQGLKAFEYPSPLHAKQITDLLPQVKASILFATDTFLNQYARVAEPGDFATLQFAVAGAEKVRDETRQMFNTKFGGVELLEGYGATEAAPVVAVNHPDRNRPGTVGQILPGMEYRIEPVEGIEVGGRLFLRGPERDGRLYFAERPRQSGAPGGRLARHRRHRRYRRRGLHHHPGACEALRQDRRRDGVPDGGRGHGRRRLADRSSRRHRRARQQEGRAPGPGYRRRRG